MNTLEHFLNIDDLAVLRMKSMGSEAPAQSIGRTLRQGDGQKTSAVSIRFSYGKF